MRSRQDLFGVGAPAVIFKTAAKAVGVILEGTGLRAYLALSLFALTFPMHAGGFFNHG
jgi:hypothetical protein